MVFCISKQNSPRKVNYSNKKVRVANSSIMLLVSPVESKPVESKLSLSNT